MTTQNQGMDHFVQPQTCAVNIICSHFPKKCVNMKISGEEMFRYLNSVSSDMSDMFEMISNLAYFTTKNQNDITGSM
jgi:hypothetical protein